MKTQSRNCVSALQGPRWLAGCEESGARRSAAFTPLHRPKPPGRGFLLWAGSTRGVKRRKRRAPAWLRRQPRSEAFGSRRDAPVAAFTLVEVLISASLMALIVASAYLCLNAAIASQKAIEPRLEVVQTARVAMALMSADLRNACPLSSDIEFLGLQRTIGEAEADSIDFATHNYTPRRPREGDFCQVSFFIDKDPESGQLSLWRRRNPAIAPDPLSGGSREELAKDVAGLKFEYYDGLDWYDTWGEVKGRGKDQYSLRERSNLYGLPEAVRITLWLNADPRARTNAPAAPRAVGPPLVFQTVARLNLAAKSQASSSTSSSAGSPTGTSAQPTPAAPGSGGPQQ